MRLADAARAGGRIAGLAVIVADALARGGDRDIAASAAAARRLRATRLGRAARRTLTAWGVAVDGSGDPPAGPALLVANHVSYLDPLVVASRVPCAPVAKAELARWPVLGAVARRCGVVFHERGVSGSGLRVMREAEQALREGLPVLNFPEGTTTRGDGVLPFRRGLFDVARRVGVPIVPVALVYAPRELAWVGDETLVPHALRLAARRASAVRVTFGAPLPSRAFPGAAELCDAAHARVRALLEEVPPCLRMTP